MQYRVILDCMAPDGATSAGFYNIRFVDARDEPQAIELAKSDLKALMHRKGYSHEDIAQHAIEVDLIEECEGEELPLESQQSFIFYSEK